MGALNAKRGFGDIFDFGWGDFFGGHHGGGKPVKPSVIAPELALPPVYQPLNGLLLGDQGADKIFHLRDLNGDGDAADADERLVFFDASNLSGLVNPAGNVFAIHQAADGKVYAGDGDTDSVYVLRDLNHDGDANDAGEARTWFSSANAGGLPLVTPNGVSTAPDGAVFIVNAGVIAGPVDDVIYRTVDTNKDGDANDAGEATAWLNLQTLNLKSSAFDLSFDGSVAYLADTNGADPDTIYRIEDANSNSTIEASEVKTFIADGNPYGVPVDFAIAAEGGSVYTWEFTKTGDTSRVFRLTDLNLSGTIDSLGEVQEVWNTSKLPAGFDNSVGFSIAAAANGDLAVTSNGGAANQRNVVRLTDLNGDGDYMDSGETIIAGSNALDPTFGDRPRSLAFYDDGSPDAHPQTYHEGGPAVLFAQALTIADADSKLLGGAVIKIVGGLDPEHDRLSVDLGGNCNIKVRYDDDTGTLTLKGLASVADYQEILRSLGFDSRVDNPDEALRTISITVQDERGVGGASQSVVTSIGVEADEDVRTLFGSDRSDRITGKSGADQVLAAGGDDVVDGKQGNDLLFGEKGNDVLKGGAGNDLLSGGAGHDTLTGGDGADTFLFTGKSQKDVVTDFDLFKGDTILFEGVTLKGVAVNSLEDAADAAQAFGPNGTIYRFDNNATLVVFEQNAFV
jgi:Ca2+-binding RTX toxin-like protein